MSLVPPAVRSGSCGGHRRVWGWSTGHARRLGQLYQPKRRQKGERAVVCSCLTGAGTDGGGKVLSHCSEKQQAQATTGDVGEKSLMRRIRALRGRTLSARHSPEQPAPVGPAQAGLAPGAPSHCTSGLWNEILVRFYKDNISDFFSHQFPQRKSFLFLGKKTMMVVPIRSNNKTVQS